VTTLILKFSQAISQVKWLNSGKNNVLKAISVLILTLRMKTEMVFEMFFSPFNHLT
jgi:hypothetical protein